MIVYEETDLLNLWNQNVLAEEASLLALFSTVGGLTTPSPRQFCPFIYAHFYSIVGEKIALN
jgi:hypothetical protein